MPDRIRLAGCLLGIVTRALAGCAHPASIPLSKRDTPEAEWQRMHIDSLQMQQEDHNARLSGNTR